MAARNARARALGYDSYYARRVAEGKARGLTRNVAAGHPGPKEIGVTAMDRLRSSLDGALSIRAQVRNPKGAPSERTFEVNVMDAEGARTISFDVRKKAAVRKVLDAEADVEVLGTP
jgi:hypothetical protein